MALAKRAERWVTAKIIDEKTMIQILQFEAEWRATTVSLLVNLLGVPLLLFGAALAIVVAYMNVGDQLGFALDLTATSTLAVGSFHVIVKKLASKSKSLSLSMKNFALGSALLVAAIGVENLSPYRSLLIWASFILFSSLLAKRLFKWLISLTTVYMAGLYLVREYFGPSPDFDPYLTVAVLMAALTPVVLLLIWAWGFTSRTWKAFWKLAVIRQLIVFLKGELERIKAAWRQFTIRRRATSIWMGKARRLILEVVGGAVLGCMLRKHFELIDGLLWESQSIYTYGTLIAWVTLLTLIPKEKYPFSMWFTFLGSLAIFLHLGQFNSPDGFKLSLQGTHYQIGHMTLGIVLLMGVSSYAKKIVENKFSASSLFTLGPLGWLTAVGLLSLV